MTASHLFTCEGEVSLPSNQLSLSPAAFTFSFLASFDNNNEARFLTNTHPWGTIPPNTKDEVLFNSPVEAFFADNGHSLALKDSKLALFVYKDWRLLKGNESQLGRMLVKTFTNGFSASHAV